MTIYDIAKQANVSTATVSRYLNGTGYVGKAAAERIAAAIAQSDYTPSGIARKLSSGGRFRLVGVACRNLEDPYYARAVAVIERELRAAGYEIIVACAGESTAEKRATVATLLGKSVDAVIFIGSVFMDEAGAIILDTARKRPCFVINAAVTGDNIYAAYCDDRAAVKTCAQLLLSEGRERLLYLHDVDTYGSEQKLAGFLAAGGRDHLRCPNVFGDIVDWFPEAYRAHRPDGVLCSNDTAAAAVLAAAARLGLSVPGQLAVVGHNNSLIAQCTTPALTSIDNGVDALSRTTAGNIVALFAGHAVPAAFRADYRIVRRESF